jgi:hypothetical protein
VSHAVLTRIGVALMLAALLLAGVVLGTYITVLRDAAAGQTPPPATPVASRVETPATLPPEVAGEDIGALPRYPASVRTRYDVSREVGHELVAVEYLASAPIADVRLYYQRVIADHGWERVDINYSDGEWAYLLLRGTEEALIKLEMARGLVEIDLQLSRPVDETAPAPPAGDDGDDGDDDDDRGDGDD